MFKSSYLGLTPEEEKKAIKEIIKFQTDLIAKNLKNNSYGDTQKNEGRSIMSFWCCVRILLWNG